MPPPPPRQCPIPRGPIRRPACPGRVLSPRCSSAGQGGEGEGEGGARGAREGGTGVAVLLPPRRFRFTPHVAKGTQQTRRGRSKGALGWAMGMQGHRVGPEDAGQRNRGQDVGSEQPSSYRGGTGGGGRISAGGWEG